MSEGVCMKELFEYMGTHFSLGEQQRAREEFEARYARWKLEINIVKEVERLGLVER